MKRNEIEKSEESKSTEMCSCYDTGEVVVCAYCQAGIYHTHCDDTFTAPCPACRPKSVRN